MKSARRGVAVAALLAWESAGPLAGCAYGGEVDPSAAAGLHAEGGGAQAGKAGAGGGSGPSPTTGAGGSAGDVPVDPGGTGGSAPTPDEAGAVDADDEAAPVGMGSGGMVDAGPRDTGVRDVVVVDVAKPPLLFDPNKLYFIKPKNGSPGIAMDVDLNSQTNGARVKQWTFSATDNAEQFYILDNGNNTWRIAMKDNKNQCVDNPANQVVDGTKLQMWQCMNNDVWQQWTITPDASGANTFQLRNMGSMLYLDQPGSSMNIDLTLQVYTQNGTNAQKWIITPTM
jgi:Ricin-type beta-trefoil lectin domain-like